MSPSNPLHAERGRSLTRRLWAGWHAAARAARLLIGIPDYAAYVHHIHVSHPGRVPMDRTAFFRERMQARYGKGRARCC